MLADISVEVVFFLVAAIIALINKLYEKSRELRARSQQQMRANEGRQRLDLVRVGAEVVEAPPQPKPIALQSIAVRPPREPQPRPPRRTRRVAAVVAVAPSPAPAGQSPLPATFVQRLRADPAALREAVVLREVLGPPVAMRGFRFPRR